MEHGGRTRDSGLVQQKQVPPSPRGFNVPGPGPGTTGEPEGRVSNSHWESSYGPSYSVSEGDGVH